MSFFAFYQSGGVLMHVVTLLAFVTAALWIRRVRAIRRAFAHPGDAADVLAGPDALTGPLLAAMVLAGALGTATGAMEVGVAVGTVPPAQAFAAFCRGLSIMVIPAIWATMCAIPLLLAHGGLRQVELRLGQALAARRA